MKNEQIARAFKDGETAKNKNMFTEKINGVLIVYSYGYHFPISVKFTDGYLFNKDGYSNTTARHKSLVLREIADDITEKDYTNTEQLKQIIDKIKYNGLKSKAEIVELKI